MPDAGSAGVAGEWIPAHAPVLARDDVHVWRVRLDGQNTALLWSLLSDPERTRASRFHSELHRVRYVAAHGQLRQLLSWYVGVAPEELQFSEGVNGKPALALPSGGSEVQFNLSHSDGLALVAVARGRAVGVDLERWDAAIEHLALAEHFFSPSEREALRQLAHSDELVVEGFFAAWSRKEAYLKASGAGISEGLHHFDVSLRPGEPARLLDDRLDEAARARWVMHAVSPGAGYSGAVVIEKPLAEIRLYDAIQETPP